MKSLRIAMVAGLLCAAGAQGVVVTPGNSAAGWQGFMNVFNLDNSYVFSSGWGVPDLRTEFNDGAGTMTLFPNSIGDANPFWYLPSGGPGSVGQKLMEANCYVQVDDGSLSGQTVTFQGSVLSNTFTSAHVAQVFIRDFAPDYSTFNETIVPLGSGNFSINLATDPGAGRHVQYGFQVKGVNVWITDIAPFGNAVIATPAPGAMAALGLAGLVAGRRRRA